MNADGLRAKIVEGAAYLERAQAPSGEFRTFWSKRLDMRGAQYVPSPFITGYILMALRETARFAPTSKLIDRGLGFLLRSRADDGLFYFLIKDIDADLDDTCLLNYILQRHFPERFDYRTLARRVARYASPKGMFPSWIRPAGAFNEIDPVVNVNIVRFLYWNGVDCAPTLSWLRRQIAAWDGSEGTHYYQSPFALPYFVATLPSGLRRSILNGQTQSFVRRLAESQSDKASTLDLAHQLFALVQFGYSEDPGFISALVTQLAAKQKPGGGWPDYAAFRAFNYWGARSLCTAVAIQALAAYGQSVHSFRLPARAEKAM